MLSIPKYMFISPSLDWYKNTHTRYRTVLNIVKKGLRASALLVLLVLFMPLPARADFADLLIDTSAQLNDASVKRSLDSLPNGTFIAADGIGGGEARAYPLSCADIEMVKKVLEPGTMLLLGSCLLGLGLFAIKFRK